MGLQLLACRNVAAVPPVEPSAWTEEDRALWSRIIAHDFEPADDTLTFTARLARDHGWSLGLARRTVDEYRRFCFLALQGAAVTPSEEVDEVWHQHLTFSRDYWQVWCAEVLRADLHHQPTRGGPAEGRRFAAQYARTLALYEAWFGRPPIDLWPGTAQRFGRRPTYRIVDARDHLILPRPMRRAEAWLRSLLVSGLVMAVLLHAEPARAEGLGILDWTAGPFLAVYLAAIIASAAAARYLPLLVAAQPPVEPRRGRLEPVELALLAGGRGRAGDVLILEALAAGDAAVAGCVLMVDGRATDRAALLRDLSGTIDGVQGRLERRGLVLRARRRLLFRWIGAAAMLPVLALGTVRLAIGLHRDKPVGILVGLLALTAIGTVAAARGRRPATRAGRQAVVLYREDNARAIRAPRAGEVIAAFACVGAKALAFTEFSDYGELLKTSTDAGGDAGCGGGGCGGCGG